MTETHKQLAEMVMSISVSTRDIWESQTRKMREGGVPLRDDVTYEDAKRFHKEKNYDILIDQTHLIHLELQMVEPVLKQLSSRKWCFARAPKGHQFITCDDPTILRWNNVQPPSMYSPGHGLKNTIVIFTLSPELALVGIFEEVPKEFDYSPDQVTAINTAVAQQSQRQIYAKDDNFLVDLKDRLNVRGADLPSAFPKET